MARKSAAERRVWLDPSLAEFGEIEGDLGRALGRLGRVCDGGARVCLAGGRVEPDLVVRGEGGAVCFSLPRTGEVLGAIAPVGKPAGAWCEWVSALVAGLLGREDGLSLPVPRGQELAEVAHFSDEFIRRVAMDETELYRLSWRHFEEFVAEMLRRDGFEVALRNHGWDGGVDILAYDRKHFGQVILAYQVKRYKPDVSISASIVRDLYGAMPRFKAHVGVVVATSDFSKDALATAKRLGVIHTQDAKAIQEWARRIVGARGIGRIA